MNIKRGKINQGYKLEIALYGETGKINLNVLCYAGFR
jgi:hypothetical protein